MIGVKDVKKAVELQHSMPHLLTVKWTTAAQVMLMNGYRTVNSMGRVLCLDRKQAHNLGIIMFLLKKKGIVRRVGKYNIAEFELVPQHDPNGRQTGLFDMIEKAHTSAQ